MATFSLALMIAAVIGVVVLILLFERKRTQQVERDLRSREQPEPAPPAHEPKEG